MPPILGYHGAFISRSSTASLQGTCGQPWEILPARSNPHLTVSPTHAGSWGCPIVQLGRDYAY